LIDGTGAQPKERVALVIRDGRIAEIRDSTAGVDVGAAETIDLEGRTLLPGLINAHMHLMMDAGPDPFAYLRHNDLPTIVLGAAKTGERMLRAGITTARDLGGYEYAELALRKAFASGEFAGPRLLCAGKVITM